MIKHKEFLDRKDALVKQAKELYGKRDIEKFASKIAELLAFIDPVIEDLYQELELKDITREWASEDILELVEPMKAHIAKVGIFLEKRLDRDKKFREKWHG